MDGQVREPSVTFVQRCDDNKARLSDSLVVAP
jgi:hypothetical protein